jgi:hypothetical protein
MLAESSPLRAFSTFVDLQEAALPAVPDAGKIRIYAVPDTNYTVLETLSDQGLRWRLAQDAFRICRNVQGATIPKGAAVYIYSATLSRTNIKLAQANSSATMPAAGIAAVDIPDNEFGPVMLIGKLSSMKTDSSGWSDGTELYVSPLYAGALTHTKPTHPNFSQWVATIEFSDNTDGTLLINTKVALGSEDGTNSNTFTIGDTQTGIKSIIFDGAADAQIDWNSATSTLTHHADTSKFEGDVVITGNIDAANTMEIEADTDEDLGFINATEDTLGRVSLADYFNFTGGLLTIDTASYLPTKYWMNNVFSGSTNITALGTIASGVWSGTPVAAAYLGNHATKHNNAGADEISLSGLSGEAADAQKVWARKGTGSNVGPRRKISFVEGSNITLTVVDDPGSEEIDVTINSTGGGGNEILGKPVDSTAYGWPDKATFVYNATKDTIYVDSSYVLGSADPGDVLYVIDEDSLAGRVAATLDTSNQYLLSTGEGWRLSMDSTLAVKIERDYMWYEITIDSSYFGAGTVGFFHVWQDAQIDSVHSNIDAGTSVPFNIIYGADRATAVDSVMDSQVTCNSTAGVASSPDDGDISAGQEIWVRCGSATGSVTELHLSVRVYRR